MFIYKSWYIDKYNGALCADCVRQKRGRCKIFDKDLVSAMLPGRRMPVRCRCPECIRAEQGALKEKIHEYEKFPGKKRCRTCKLFKAYLIESGLRRGERPRGWRTKVRTEGDGTIMYELATEMTCALRGTKCAAPSCRHWLWSIPPNKRELYREGECLARALPIYRLSQKKK